MLAVIQLGNAQWRQVFEMKELLRLQDRLQDEKQCRESLEKLIKQNPVEYFEEYRTLLEHARKLELDPRKEPVVAEAKRLFESVKDRIEVRDAARVSNT